MGGMVGTSGIGLNQSNAEFLASYAHRQRIQNSQLEAMRCTAQAQNIELNRQQSLANMASAYNLHSRMTPITPEEFRRMQAQAEGKPREDQPILVRLEPKETLWCKIKKNPYVKQLLKEFIYK